MREDRQHIELRRLIAHVLIQIPSPLPLEVYPKQCVWSSGRDTQTPLRSQPRRFCQNNAEGVCQFQPRVTPWDKQFDLLNRTPKVLARQEFVLANPFRVETDLKNAADPGCYPGLELANAFGVHATEAKELWTGETIPATDGLRLTI
jgi:hypothetical protein